MTPEEMRQHAEGFRAYVSDAPEDYRREGVMWAIAAELAERLDKLVTALDVANGPWAACGRCMDRGWLDAWARCPECNPGKAKGVGQ